MWPALARSFDALPSGHPRQLRELIESQGGFTVRLGSGRAVSSGISVGTRPSRSLRFDRDGWSDRLVDEWMMSVAAEPAWRARHVGGWIDPWTGAVSLDVVRVVPRPFKRLAMALGRATSQKCVFDLGRQQMLVLQ